MKKTLLLLLLCSAVTADPFDRVFNFILTVETADYCRDGEWESRYGISKRWYPKEDLANMTLERAKGIYRKDYWERIGANVMHDTMLALVYMVFAVHCGQPTAVAAQRDCWDKKVLFERYVDKLCRVLDADPGKKKYTKTWMMRTAFLAAAINLNK